MADKSGIEWTQSTWNPIAGCAVHSPGCTNCYAMALAGTRLKASPRYAGLTQETKAGPVWTGEVRFDEAAVQIPLQWRRPRLIFVNSMSDLFAEAVPDAWIDQSFAVMWLTPQHTYQVLTKRAERMRAYLTDPETPARVAAYCLKLMDEFPGCIRGQVVESFPLPNVWLGVSAEDQTRADERIPELLVTPAAVRFVSIEPMIGPIDLFRIAVPDAWAGKYAGHGHTFNALMREDDLTLFNAPAHLDWVIVGGESGSSARPMPLGFGGPRTIRGQCHEAGTAFFFKQWGEHAPTSDTRGPYMARVGRQRAGRLLDGAEHNAMPPLNRGEANAPAAA